MSDMFEIVDSLPAGRAGRTHEVLEAFMKADARYVKLVDPVGLRPNTLTLIARQRDYPIRVHRDGTDIYLERTDLVGADQIR